MSRDGAEREKRAVQRVRQAGVKAREREIAAWIRSVGPDTVLKAGLREIREAADAF